MSLVKSLVMEARGIDLEHAKSTLEDMGFRYKGIHGQPASPLGYHLFQHRNGEQIRASISKSQIGDFRHHAAADANGVNQWIATYNGVGEAVDGIRRTRGGGV